MATVEMDKVENQEKKKGVKRRKSDNNGEKEKSWKEKTKGWRERVLINAKNAALLLGKNSGRVNRTLYPHL